MSRIERIATAIQTRYPNGFVLIKDETKKHIGHREIIENQNPQETHLSIIVQDSEFESTPPINSIREINRLIKDEFSNGLHAVDIQCEPLVKEQTVKEEESKNK